MQELSNSVPANRLVCPASGQRCYPSKRIAREAMRYAHNRIRLYFCKACRSWHGTCQAKTA
jgi:hypothetical protein